MRAEASSHSRWRAAAALLALLLPVTGAPADPPPATPATADGSTLGRLFMTPAERAALDAERSHPGAEVAAPAPAATLPEQVLLSGVLTRSRGPDTVWINGEQATAGQVVTRVQPGPDASHRVTVTDPAVGTTARLKPGQVWTPRTGRVSECLGCKSPDTAKSAAPSGTETAADAPVTPAAKPAASTALPSSPAAEPAAGDQP